MIYSSPQYQQKIIRLITVRPTCINFQIEADKKWETQFQ